MRSIFFLFPCIIFKVNFQLWGSEMPSCSITPYQWCVYWLLGLSEYLREGLKINKGPLLGYIDSLHLWLPVGLQSIQFQPPYKVRIVRRFLTLWHSGSTYFRFLLQFHRGLFIREPQIPFPTSSKALKKTHCTQHNAGWSHSSIAAKFSPFSLAFKALSGPVLLTWFQSD